MGKRGFELGPLAPQVSGVRMRAMDSLPGSDLVKTGIVDLQSKRETIPALLVAIGARNCGN